MKVDSVAKLLCVGLGQGTYVEGSFSQSIWIFSDDQFLKVLIKIQEFPGTMCVVFLKNTVQMISICLHLSLPHLAPVLQ